ncbi:MAG: NnrU family protein [Pseudomonadota bacterium]
MIEFLIALAAFIAAHVLPAATGLRARLIDRLGRSTYLIGYSAVSLVTLVWLVSAALRAPYIGLWPTGPVTALVPIVAMLPACVLAAGAATRPNPLSISFLGGQTDPEKPGILALVRHPILWAFFLWSASHAIANGDLVALIMFGGFALFSLAGMGRMERRAKQTMTPDDFQAAMAISRGASADRLRQAFSVRTVIELVAGVVLFAALLALHGPVIGIYPLALI